MKTFLPNAQESLDNRKWHVVDASGVVLGRLASRVAMIIRGKHRPTYTPHLDTGDFVVIINAEKVAVTGKKDEQNEYMFFSGFVGGESYRSLKLQRERNPEFIIKHAVKGMLPKNKLGAAQLNMLKIYAGSDHPHAAQQPQPLP